MRHLAAASSAPDQTPEINAPTAMDLPDRAAPRGRNGPNGITRTAQALDESLGYATTLAVFVHAGLSDCLQHPPEGMVDETAVTRLNQVLYELLAPLAARAIARAAGAHTGDYLPAQRIPAPVQVLLRCLPAARASRVLLAAIGRHACTFAGTGTFRARAGRPVRLSIVACPMCRGTRATAPRCDYYAVCLEQLFRALVHRGARVTETACAAMGADACRFEVRWT